MSKQYPSPEEWTHYFEQLAERGSTPSQDIAGSTVGCYVGGISTRLPRTPSREEQLVTLLNEYEEACHRARNAEDEMFESNKGLNAVKDRINSLFGFRE